jgi:hypothetical protein
MFYRILLTLSLIIVYQNSIAANPASQDWVKGYVAANYIPSQVTINWPSLCLSGQSLTSLSGCTPDCTDSSVSCPATSARGLPGLSAPSYLKNGVIVFQLTQTGSLPNPALTIQTTSLPSHRGYMCDVLNSDGSPVTLYAVSSSPNPRIVTTHSIDIVNTSSRLFTSVAQPLSSLTGLWYQNPNNPLYLVCLGYQRAPGSSVLQPSPVCGGTGNACINYSLS